MSFYRRYRLALNLLGLVLLVALIILFKIDLGQTLSYLARANLIDLIVAILLFVPFLASKAWRWQVILRDLDISISFSEALKLYALGLGAGMITPGQIGDAVKVAYFRERGLGRATLSVVLDRLWDLLMLLLLATSGAFVFWNELQGEWLAVGALLVGTLILLAFALNPRAQHYVITRLAKGLNLAETPVDNFQALELSGSQIARQSLLTLLATAVVYLRLYLLAHALDVQLGVIPFVATMSIASVATLIPISISGVGTRDAALLLIAPVIGITREQALGLSVLILLLSVINGLVGYLVFSFAKSDSRANHAPKG